MKKALVVFVAVGMICVSTSGVVASFPDFSLDRTRNENIVYGKKCKTTFIFQQIQT